MSDNETRDLIAEVERVRTTDGGLGSLYFANAIDLVDRLADALESHLNTAVVDGRVYDRVDGVWVPGDAEPDEWEYGCAWDDGESQVAIPYDQAEAHIRRFPDPNGRIVRRRKSAWEAMPSAETST